MPWAGWDEPVALPADTRALLAEFLGTELRPSASVPEAEVVLPPSRLPTAAQRDFAAVVGASQVHTGRVARPIYSERAIHSADCISFRRLTVR